MIQSINHLSYVLKIPKEDLLSLSQKESISRYYYEYSIHKLDSRGQPKRDKNGDLKKRIITPSKLQLKKVQKNINKYILGRIPFPNYIFGGARAKDNVLNAKQHQGKKFKFITDLKDFFPRITNKMVYEMFVSHNFSPDVAGLLTRITTYKGHLPQGAPTSTHIANLVFIKTGNELQQLATEYNITFTSFVDDLTFSSKFDFKHLVPTIIEIITKNGFIINQNKTHYQTSYPSITGVICCNNKLAAPEHFLKVLNDRKSLRPEQYQGMVQYKRKIENIAYTKTKKINHQLERKRMMKQ